MATVVNTEHPHIVRLEGICGGEPIIAGLRVTVRPVATLYLRGAVSWNGRQAGPNDLMKCPDCRGLDQTLCVCRRGGPHR